MKAYSDFVDRIFRAERALEKLTPSDVLDRELLREIRAADDAKIAGARRIADAAHLALVRGGLFYAVDALDAAHAIFQEAHDDLGSYWHGMLHRREGDFDNARYWFRRAGRQPFFDELHRAAANLLCRHGATGNLGSNCFTGQCERMRRRRWRDLLDEMRILQRAELGVIFDYCWRRAFIAG